MRTGPLRRAVALLVPAAAGMVALAVASLIGALLWPRAKGAELEPE